MANVLFEIPFHVLRTPENTDVPENTIGAHVIGYSAAPDIKQALQNAAVNLRESGWHIEDVDGKVREIPAEKWTAYVTSVWPEYVDHFPTELELPQKIAECSVFFGLFATYNKQ